MKDKIKEILVDVYQTCGRSEDEAAERILRLFNASKSVVVNPDCNCDKSDDGYCCNILCRNFYPQ